MGKLVYLATPYTHQDPEVRERRFRAVSRCAGWLLCHAGVLPFSPISMGHPILNEVSHIPGTTFEWHFWAEFDTAMILKSEEFWVYCQDGWKTSTGVAAELKIVTEHDIPVRYVVDAPDGGYAVFDSPPADS